MGDLTKNISKHELLCKCGNPDCSFTVLDYEDVIDVVQECCNHFAVEYGVDKVTLIITSAARCNTHNKSPEVGSNDNSRHTRGDAIDFKIKVKGLQLEPRVVYDYLDAKYTGRYGVGLYKTFTHVDTRSVVARW